MAFLIDTIYNLGIKIGENQSRLRSDILEIARNKHELNDLIARHSLPHSELAKLVGLDRRRLHAVVEEAVEKGVMNTVMRDVNKYRYTLRHIHQLMDYLNIPKWNDSFRECISMAVSNLKGGTGKTSTVIHLAAALALDLNLRPRVLVIDFDPQGSLSGYALTSEDDDSNTITAIDIALAPFEDASESQFNAMLEAGYTENEIFGHALIETHIPNLHVMPAFPQDHRFDNAYYGSPDELKAKVISSLKDEVLAKLKDHYDIILIDTGPHNAPTTWAAIEACNALLVPVSPRSLDWNATGLFMRTVPPYVKAFNPSKGENIKWFKLACVNADKEHNRDVKMMNVIKQTMGNHALSMRIFRTPAFEEAARNYVTVLDLKKGESDTSNRKIDEAVGSVTAIADEVKFDLLANFGA